MSMQDDIDTLKGVVAWLTNELAGADHDALERVVAAIDGAQQEKRSHPMSWAAWTLSSDGRANATMDFREEARWVGPWKETTGDKND